MIDKQSLLNKYDGLLRKLIKLRKDNNYKESIEEDRVCDEMDVVWNKLVGEDKELQKDLEEFEYLESLEKVRTYENKKSGFEEVINDPLFSDGNLLLRLPITKTHDIMAFEHNDVLVEFSVPKKGCELQTFTTLWEVNVRKKGVEDFTRKTILAPTDIDEQINFFESLRKREEPSIRCLISYCSSNDHKHGSQFLGWDMVHKSPYIKTIFYKGWDKK